jgi:predicted acylesterase/phospholipase RssA
MTRRGDRPQFHVVTGVSAGALIAPFAFLGPAWDDELKEAFDSYRPSQLLQPRGWLAFLFLPGYYRGEPLIDLVDHFVTDRLIQAVAEQAAQGRLLLVATTDLDKEESVIWDMGAIAARGGEPARQLFRDVLIASASIPGLFPPVLIHVEGAGNSYDEMHVDGGTTVSFFVTSEIAQQEKKHFHVLDRAQVFVLVNGQLSTYPQTTRERPISVLARSFSAGLTHTSRRTLELTAAFADRYEMDFRFTYVPVTYPFKGPLDFKFSSMHALFEFGARCAEAGRLWTTLQQAMGEAQHAATTMSQQTDDCPVSNARP